MTGKNRFSFILGTIFAFIAGMDVVLALIYFIDKGNVFLGWLYLVLAAILVASAYLTITSEARTMVARAKIEEIKRYSKLLDEISASYYETVKNLQQKVDNKP